MSYIAGDSDVEVTKSRQSDDEIALELAVRLGTNNPDATGRPGQVLLLKDIVAAMSRQGHVCAQAPTGVGKSMAVTVPAMMRAARATKVGDTRRTVISTESLSLQKQYVSKDLPIVQDAVRELTGVTVKFAIYKGWANYVCPAAVSSHAQEMIDQYDIEHPQDTKGLDSVALLESVREKTPQSESDPDVVDVRGVKVSSVAVVEILEWAANVLKSNLENADKDHFPGSLVDGVWGAVSMPSDECPGLKECPFANDNLCAPAAARDEAGFASIVVTNHAMLAVQAAKEIPAVLGNKYLGAFDYIVVDEAHALPGVIRSAGAVELSGSKIMSILNAVVRQATGGQQLESQSRKKNKQSKDEEWLSSIVSTGEVLSHNLDAWLTKRAGTGLSGTANISQLDYQKPISLRVDEAINPILMDKISAWAHDIHASPSLEHARQSSVDNTAAKARNVSARLMKLVACVTSLTDNSLNLARWIEFRETADHDMRPMLCASPVDVAPLLKANIWRAPIRLTEGYESEGFHQGMDESLQQQYKNLAVIACSGTLPNGFESEIGLKAQVKQYESPFKNAYGSSWLYVPECESKEDVDACSRIRVNNTSKVEFVKNNRGRRLFDTDRHRAWILPQIEDLVWASGGHALVLSATRGAGQEYAARLRERFGQYFNVYSQWDGKTVGKIVETWKSDVSSVLVGTKSLMTGTDAPGTTCRLVILDRPPRAAKNPVDEARVQALIKNQGLDKWDAVARVYVLDASLTLGQSVGRLIRRETDFGVVAVMDPRLLSEMPKRPFSYTGETSRIYRDAFADFPKPKRTFNAMYVMKFLQQIRDDEARNNL